jgi:hypothetical protein
MALKAETVSEELQNKKGWDAPAGTSDISGYAWADPLKREYGE